MNELNNKTSYDEAFYSNSLGISPLLYLDCSAGISGDMIVAALLDVGASEQKLRRVLDSLSMPECAVEITRVEKAGVSACDFKVVLGNIKARHAHHTLSEIKAIINASCATPRAKQIATRAYQVLAQAEAKAHKVAVNEVHFHEVGALDSVADVLAAAVCLDDLNPEEVIVPHVCEGQGTIRCAHGVLPVPVPAVAHIVADNNISLTVLNVQGELVTPTGAAFVAATRTSTQLPNTYTVVRTGYGAGKRVYPETTGLLRALLLTTTRCFHNEAPVISIGKELYREI